MPSTLRLSSLTAISAFGLAVGAELIEIGAHRRLHDIDEMADDAVLVEAVDSLQRRVDLGRQRGLAGGAHIRSFGHCGFAAFGRAPE